MSLTNTADSLHCVLVKMKLRRYELNPAPDLLSFEFVSEGPKGKISKLIHYTQTEFGHIYNLSFGDKDKVTGEINDDAITNNGDSQKVLNTVAGSVYIFLNKYPAAWIYATGNSKSRNRLYRIALNNKLNEILVDFELFGLINSTWQKFEKYVDYEAFLLRRKFIPSPYEK